MGSYNYLGEKRFLELKEEETITVTLTTQPEHTIASLQK